MADPDDGARPRTFADMLGPVVDGPALLGVLPALLGPFLEGQRAFLGWYQKVLEEEASTHALEDQFRALERSFFAAYLQFALAQREHQQALMQAQSQILKTYLAMVDRLLGRADGDTA